MFVVRMLVSFTLATMLISFILAPNLVVEAQPTASVASPDPVADRDSSAMTGNYCDFLKNNYTTWLGFPESFLKAWVNASELSLNYTGVGVWSYHSRYMDCRLPNHNLGSIAVADSTGVLSGRRVNYEWYPHMIRAEYALSEEVKASITWLFCDAYTLLQVANITYTGQVVKNVELVIFGEGEPSPLITLKVRYNSSLDSVVLHHSPADYIATSSNLKSASHTIATSFDEISKDISDGSFINSSYYESKDVHAVIWFALHYDVLFKPGETKTILVGIARSTIEAEALDKVTEAVSEDLHTITLRLNRMEDYWNSYLDKAPKISGIKREFIYTYYHTMVAALSSIHPPNPVAEMPYYAPTTCFSLGKPFVLEVYSIVQTCLLVNTTLAKDIFMGIINSMNASGYVRKTLYGAEVGVPPDAKYGTPLGHR